MSEMKNALDGINRRLDISEENISIFEDITLETIQNETQRKIKRKINNINEL